MLVSFYFKIVLTLTQDRCTICAERTMGSEYLFGCTRWNSLVTWVIWNFVLVHLETVLVSVKDRCTACAKHTIGSEIILDAPSDTSR
jgi:hypothetical protein